LSNDKPWCGLNNINELPKARIADISTGMVFDDILLHISKLGNLNLYLYNKFVKG
jgi:hypothetical protein